MTFNLTVFPSIAENAAAGSLAQKVRSTIVLVGGYTFVVVGLWGIFGISNGFNGETGLIYPSDIASGLDGFFYDDPLRKFTSVFYHLAYLLGAAVGERGSFVPYQLVYGALWVLRSVLTYLIVQRLMPGRPALAILAGLFAALHAADGALNWIGQLNQFGFIFLMLLSFFLLLVAMDSRRMITATLWAAASALAGFMSLWSYESPLPVMLAFPFAAALLCRDVPLARLFYASGIYLIPVAAFIGENVQRYLTSRGDGGFSYQASVIRKGFSPEAVVSDLWQHIANSLCFWKWPEAYFRVDRSWGYVLALLPVLAAILLLVPTAIYWESRSTRPFRVDLRLLAFACLSFGLLVASYLVILLLDGNNLLWRTEFLPSFAAACLGGTALYALLDRVQTTARRTVLAVGVTTFVGVFSVLAGVNSGMFFYEIWERHRVVMSSIIANAPNVTDGTLFVIRNVDPQDDPFGHNMWFDLALRLAYPDKLVAGTYFFREGSPAEGANIDIANGKPHLLPGEMATTLFHSMPDPWIDRIIVFDFDHASGQVEPVPAGPVKVGNNEVPAVDYDFCDAIKGFEPDPIAVRRYGPITTEHRITCPMSDAVRTARRAAAFAHARSLSLATMVRTSGAPLLAPNASGVAFRSAPEPWSSIGQMPLLAGCLAGGGWVAVDVLVTHGVIGIVVLNREGGGLLVGGSAASSSNIQTVYLRLNSFAGTGDLVLRNWMRSSTEGVLKAVRIAAEDGSKPAACDSDPVIRPRRSGPT
jgi:hypothetical protein